MKTSNLLFLGTDTLLLIFSATATVPMWQSSAEGFFKEYRKYLPVEDV
jgi:hypothetical protein